jgi:GNAT superfamily N-acetyltransferase
MATANPYVYTPAAHSQLIPYLAALYASCITQDGLVATFLPPLSHDKLLAWWRERIAESNAGTRVILLLLDESEPGSRAKGNELVGVAMLAMPVSETGAFRAYVEELLVTQRYRRRGAATTLLNALEMEALQRGKTLLVSCFPQAFFLSLVLTRI